MNVPREVVACSGNVTLYTIRPGVDHDGNPIWELWRSMNNAFNFDVKLLAKNADKTVLQRAIKHLTGEANG